MPVNGTYSYDAANVSVLGITLKITDAAIVIVDTISSGPLFGAGTILIGHAVKIQLIATSTDSNGHNMRMFIIKNGDVVFDSEIGATFGDAGLEYDYTVSDSDVFSIGTSVT